MVKLKIVNAPNKLKYVDRLTDKFVFSYQKTLIQIKVKLTYINLM
jgi:hypothetical protein